MDNFFLVLWNIVEAVLIFEAVIAVILGAIKIFKRHTKKKNITDDKSEDSEENNLPSQEDMMNIMTLFECLDEIYKTR